jgi:glyoxylase-like metal-dependent hydrolase (beta-lactamase superfamily II)
MSVFPDFPRVRDAGGVLIVDTFHNGLPGTIAVFAVPLPEGGFALVESGPGVTLENVEAGVEAAGLDLRELRALLVTHIHLDHAGAAGALAAAASNAEVVVHAIGARHLADPTRLLGSARRIYGEAMDRLWGPMQPVPAERLRAVEGGERLRLGGLEIEVIYTPGHASHHVSYLLGDGTLFTGDSAGIRLPASPLTRPALPPPELSLEAWEDSVARMRAAQPRRLMLTHFGEVSQPDVHLAGLPVRNRAWAEAILAGINAGEGEAALVARVQRLEDGELASSGAPAGVAYRNKVTSDAAMTVMGVSRYWRKHHPERLREEA